MIGFTLYTFGIPIKYVILIALIALYGKYYLENKGIISTTKFDNVPYTNNNLNLIAKIKEFNAYSPPMVQSILNDYDQFFFIHNKIITDNTDFSNQYVEKLNGKLNDIYNNFHSLVHTFQNNDIVRKYHQQVLQEIREHLTKTFKISYNKCITDIDNDTHSKQFLPQTDVNRTKPSNVYSMDGEADKIL